MGDSLSIQNKFAANSQACSRTNHFIKLLWQCFIPGWPPLPHWLFPWFLSVPSVGECSGHEISFPDKPQQSIRKWGSLLALTHCKTNLNAQVDQKLFIDHQSALVMLCSKYPPLTSSSQPPLWPHLLTPPPPPSLSPIIKLRPPPTARPGGAVQNFSTARQTREAVTGFLFLSLPEADGKGGRKGIIYFLVLPKAISILRVSSLHPHPKPNISLTDRSPHLSPAPRGPNWPCLHCMGVPLHCRTFGFRILQILWEFSVKLIFSSPFPLQLKSGSFIQLWSQRDFFSQHLGHD